MALYNSQSINSGIDGSTVTPTDVVATWLECAGLHQSYTTLNEVLANSGVLSALMESTNAVDYLVRSTTWAATICADEIAVDYITSNDYCFKVLFNNLDWRTALRNSAYFIDIISNPLIPTMTSNTTPSGVVSGSNTLGDNFDYFKAFDNSGISSWCLTSKSFTTNKYLQYKFDNAKKAFKAKVVFDSYVSAISFKIQGSNNGTTFTDLTDNITDIMSGEYWLNNVYDYLYYRLYINSQTVSSNVNTGRVRVFQVFGISSNAEINGKVNKTDIAYVENELYASRAYAVGQQFYLNGSLYKAKAAIASGATFTIGTNCELADCVTEQLRWVDITSSITFQTGITWNTNRTYFKRCGKLVKFQLIGILPSTVPASYKFVTAGINADKQEYCPIFNQNWNDFKLLGAAKVNSTDQICVFAAGNSGNIGGNEFMVNGSYIEA